MAGIKVEAKGRPTAHRLQRPPGRGPVERDLSRVYLQGELHAALVEHVQDRVPQLGEGLEAVLHHLVADGREAVEQVPDGRPGEAVHHLDPHVLGRLGRVLHGPDRPLALLLSAARTVRGREPVAPRVVVGVAHELARQVVADREQLQAVPVQDRPLPVAVLGVLGGLVHVQVVAPTGQLQPVVSEPSHLLREPLQGQVRPLARKDRHRSCHR